MRGGVVEDGNDLVSVLKRESYVITDHTLQILNLKMVLV